MKNILFSTTRQWNPGDEFILMGVLNLLKEAGFEFNPIIYNRNPDIRHEIREIKIADGKYSNQLKPLKSKIKKNITKKIKKSLLKDYISECRYIENGKVYWDNSFKDYFNTNFVDLAVFAGSPEWISCRLEPMYNYIIKHNIPTLFLGIGSSFEFDINLLGDKIFKVLSKTKVLIVRDSITFKILQEYNPVRLPCPALFSVISSKEREIKQVHKIGLIYSTNKSVEMNNVSTEAYKYLRRLYELIINRYNNVEFICHYIDELFWINEDFRKLDVNYSFNSQDYIDIYSKYDLVIGPRLHGIGMSASMGIPGICIVHDKRGDAAEGFKADKVLIGEPYDNALQKIENLILKIKSKSKQILEHKELSKREFLKLIKKSV